VGQLLGQQPLERHDSLLQSDLLARSDVLNSSVPHAAKQRAEHSHAEPARKAGRAFIALWL
jgi:hypothetical protein